ncbi:OmpH family outer membrane protein [Bacteroides sp. 224]|uniref:OmpH family outer membrane protein n=1 Tax=Bacteroides sp. 224 TaxID=2302936 RepID=UPI0013D2A28F|nr:OmpH family outer membrane protein [Bacteroides sp. 224]NDV66384.1 OmpH family outer membrane protein [Bacteroides sp. 224]
MRKSVLFIMLMLGVSMAAQAQKFAFIDTEYILEAIPAYKQASEQMDASAQKWQSEIEAVAKTAEELYKDYQAKMSSLSESQRKQKEDAIITKEKEVNELKRAYFGPEGELYKMREKLLTPINNAIYEAVKALAEQNGYSAVVDRASASSVIFASPRIDISNEVLAKLGYSN